MDKLEIKKVWADSDFSDMGWHDCTIWAYGANPEAGSFSIDLDYIFKWVDPAPGESHFKFWVSPATMVFENVSDVNIELDSGPGTFEIAELSKSAPLPSSSGAMNSYIFHFDCQEGSIKFRASGFKMYVRRDPMLGERQRLSFKDRNGFSLLIPNA